MTASPRVVAACKAYAAHFGMPKAVFYPACGADESVAVAFEGASIVCLDPERSGLIEIARAHPLVVVLNQKAEEAREGARYDLVVSIHSHAPLLAEIRDLKRGGHLLIANKMADIAFELPTMLSLQAAIHTPHEGGAKVDSANLAKYLEEDPNAGCMRFTNSRLVQADFYVFKKFA